MFSSKQKPASIRQQIKDRFISTNERDEKKKHMNHLRFSSEPNSPGKARFLRHMHHLRMNGESDSSTKDVARHFIHQLMMNSESNSPDENKHIFGKESKMQLHTIHQIERKENLSSEKGGIDRGQELMNHAANDGNLKDMIWLRENNYPLNKVTYLIATRREDVKMLQWLVSQKCPR
jgi:hypothetical protein